jgi:hypothetical protein
MQISPDQGIVAIKDQLDMVAVVDEAFCRRGIRPTAIGVDYLLNAAV